MAKIRIEAGSYVLKNSGTGYVVGKPQHRVIRKKETERVNGPHYYNNFGCAVRKFGTLVAADAVKWEDRRLAIQMLAWVPVLAPLLSWAALKDVRTAARIPKRVLSGMTGVSRSTVKAAENQRQDLRTSTFFRLVRACTVKQ
jgi:hypothetical protein